MNQPHAKMELAPSMSPALMRMAAALLIGTLAPLFDTTITNVAIHTLGEALHASVSGIQWVMTSYLLALGMVIPITGWAMERFGGKRMWMAALTTFLAGSVLCSLAWNLGSLIAFRAIQGIGGGLMLPVMQTMLIRAAGSQKLGKLMAMIGLPTLLGPILGPVLGGLIVDRLDWRWIFYVNIPICLVALALAWRWLPRESPRERSGRLDFIGLLLLSPALVLIIYGLAQVGSHHGFGHSAVLVPLLGGVALLAVFIGYALRTSGTPVIDLRLFRIGSFTASSVLFFLSGLSTYGGMLLLPMYYQQVRGEGILASGLLLVPQGIGMLLTRTLAGKLTDQIGPRPVVIGGLLLTALGTLPFTQAGAASSLFALGAALVVRGAGLGAVFLPVMAASYQGLSSEQIAHSSSATRIIQQVGGAFGASVLAVILENRLTGPITPLTLAHAYDHTFLWSLGFTVVGLIPAALLPALKRSPSHIA
ncbi:MDR family MFS transporter [Gorillibacterium sp. sgz500922]|uniref:MDR family MFS transporter n=1 Tax=Gorillibacterium sp. sgz500922 TaxID=3446694 RepID=UPI003F66AD3F